MTGDIKEIKYSIIADIGEALYYRSCEWMHRLAENPHHIVLGRVPTVNETDVLDGLAHELCDYIWDNRLPPDTRIKLCFEFYDDTPCYTHLMYAAMEYGRIPTNVRELFWRKFRERLVCEVPYIVEPLEYSLWCDFFENPVTVNEAWNALVMPGAHSRILQSVLSVSGPVPYPTKRELYGRLLPDSSWHQSIFESLDRSYVDFFGQLDANDALDVLRQLQISKENAAELERRLKIRIAAK